MKIRDRITALVLIAILAQPLFADSRHPEPEPASLGALAQVGIVSQYSYTAPSDRMPRDVVYYLPLSAQAEIAAGRRLKTLMFLHGGGASTRTQASATQVARMYVPLFVRWAEDRKVLLIFPTFTWAWDSHFSWMLRPFVDHLVGQMAADRENIVLAGHSMGGMGITRVLPWATDLFSGALALNAGTAPELLTDHALLPYLNGIRYTHINGDLDHFAEFKPRMLAFETALKNLEQRTGLASNFKLLFHPGGHNPDMALAFRELDELFSQPRKFFTRFLVGGVGFARQAATLDRPAIHQLYDCYGWICATQYTDSGQSSGMRFKASVHGQVIRIATSENTMKVRELELTLSPELLDVKKAVWVEVNRRKAYLGIPSFIGATTRIRVPVER